MITYLSYPLTSVNTLKLKKKNEEILKLHLLGYIIFAFLHRHGYLLLLFFSDEAARNTGKAWTDTYTRSQLVCAAIMCYNW